MKFLILTLATLALVLSVLAAPLPTGATALATPATAVAHHTRNIATSFALAATTSTDGNHPPATTATPKTNWLSTLKYFLFSSSSLSGTISRRGRKMTTAAEAKDVTGVPCWAQNGALPDECYDEKTGKVYVAMKEQKKGEDWEQAAEESAMWNAMMYGSIKGTAEYMAEAGEA